MRLLVCGSREFNDRERVRRALVRIKPTLVIHGGARGADVIAGQIARELGIPTEVYPALWDKYGKRAGFVRNRQMLDEGKPDLVLAFPVGESRGTRMMMDIAAQAGVRVICAE